MKIEAGKRYWRRDGTISGVITSYQFPFSDDCFEESYDENGRIFPDREHNKDLISEYVESTAVPKDEQPAETETLRDRFAMAALQGLLACDAMNAESDGDPKKWYSSRAYKYADAMLAARKKGKTKLSQSSQETPPSPPEPPPPRLIREGVEVVKPVPPKK